ncbi:11802_t:CDS:1, partial [Dentiscutata heterogama]
MSSELELLKQHITELEMGNAELRKENIEISDFRRKISVFYSERAELICIIAKTLKMTKEERRG